jgi:hypothetical protein
MVVDGWSAAQSVLGVLLGELVMAYVNNSNDGLISEQEAGILYDLYVALHRAHKQNPGFMTDQDVNAALTHIMARKRFSWRVIGITRKALMHFKELKFRYKSGEGLTRAHLVPRIVTVRSLFAPEQPVSQSEFIETWLKNDVTVICVRGENSVVVPEYIPIKNDNGTLFSCHRRLAGWTQKMPEQELLKSLFESLPAVE